MGAQTETITFEKLLWPFSIKLNKFFPEEPAISLLLTVEKWTPMFPKKKKEFVPEYS